MMVTQYPCRGCGSPSEALLDFGPQPLGNRFPGPGDGAEYRHPLSLRSCPRCGLVQLGEAPPSGEVRPRVDWIAYNEPEAHLDAAMARLAGLPGLERASRILGVSLKDDTSLDRLARLGFSGTRRLDPGADLGLTDARCGMESIQAALHPGAAAALATRLGGNRLVLARHILEHAHDPSAFLAALRAFLEPGGYLCVEVPDCRRALERRDYSTLWEEHILYLTPLSLAALGSACGLSLVHWESHPLPLENSLVAVFRTEADGAASFPPAVDPEGKRWEAAVLEERGRAAGYGNDFAAVARKHRERLRALKAEGGVALFGAGHLSVTFINLLGLREWVDAVIDDNPHKQGLRMPGSGIPIVPSAELAARGIRHCLLSVTPDKEEAIIGKNRAFADAGGVFHSIYPWSPRALAV